MAKQDNGRRSAVTARTGAHSEKEYTRFVVAQRIEHIILLTSFTLLALTGLPQRYAGSGLAEWLIAALGGIESIRTIHHISAIVFVALAIYHCVVLAYKIFVLHTDLSMLPGTKDLTDFVGLVRYNLGLSKERPAFPRYSFDEKVEYWAMIWGTVAMAITGFMLWNPILVTKFLPGEFVPAAKAAHGGEAVLAVLAILVWHLYNVHIKTFNKSMFTGTMTEHHMAREHGDELERIKAGQGRPRPAEVVIRQRARVIMPIAIVGAVLALGVVYWLATAEKTAIATIPTPAVRVFVPLPPTLAPAINAQIGKPIPHDLAGKEKCDTCHGPQGIKPYPDDHAGRPNVSCQVCHQAGPATDAATPVPDAARSITVAAIPHPVQGREDCLMCHKAGGLNPVPSDHAGRANDTCQACHKPSPGISGTPAAASASAAGTPAAPAAGSPPAITHALDATHEQCLVCHQPGGGLKPSPANHAGYTQEMCQGCHKPASASSAAQPTAKATSAEAGPTAAATEPAAPAAGSPPAITHALDATHEQCLVCHQPGGGLKPSPANHAGYTQEMCQGCHKPAP